MTRFLVLLLTFAMISAFLPAAAFAAVPQSRHVWILVEENHSYENVMANMPYLVSLANRYGLATQSYSDMHNSLSALMHLVAGATVTLNDSTTSIFSNDNLPRHLLSLGLTWRAYQESLPYAGDATIGAYPYVKRHNPLAYFTDTNSASQRKNWEPYPGNMAALVAANYNYITPNLLDDAHNGTMAQADDWLKQHLPAILARPEFQPGGDGLMIITFDEGNLSTDNRCSATVSNGCGGRVFTAVLGPQVRVGFRSSTWHNHESVLKTVCEALGLGMCPGAAQSANDLGEFFVTPQNSAGVGGCSPGAKDLSVIFCSPAASAPTDSATFAVASTDATHPVNAMALYVDSVERYFIHSNAIAAPLTLTPGAHTVVARAWDSSGAYFSSASSVAVAACAAPSGSGVRLCWPGMSASVANPIHLVSSSASGAYPVVKTVVYVDGAQRYWTASARVDTFLTLSLGTHDVMVRSWDSTGAVYEAQSVFAVN